jgi:anti-anti-sigma factor
MRWAHGASTGAVEAEVNGDTLIVTATEDFQEIAFQEVEAGARARNVVVDFRHTASYASTSPAFFDRMWRRVTSRGGRMAFCNVSRREEELLRLTSLDQLWPVCSSREEALAAVKAAHPHE